MIFLLAARHRRLRQAARASTCPTVLTQEAQACRAIEAQQGRPVRRGRDRIRSGRRSHLRRRPGPRPRAGRSRQYVDCRRPAGQGRAALDKALAGTGLQAEQHGLALLDRARAAEAQGDLKTARAKIDEAAKTIGDDPYLWYFSAAVSTARGKSSCRQVGDQSRAGDGPGLGGRAVRGGPYRQGGR